MVPKSLKQSIESRTMISELKVSKLLETKGGKRGGQEDEGGKGKKVRGGGERKKEKEKYREGKRKNRERKEYRETLCITTLCQN